MSESEKGATYKVSISRKAQGGNVFVNINSIFANPDNQELADKVVEEIESEGFSRITVAMGDRLDLELKHQIERARGVWKARRAKQLDGGRSTGAEGPRT